MTLTQRAGAVVTADRLHNIVGATVVPFTPAGALTTTSGTYANLSTWTTVFTKRDAASRLEVGIYVSSTMAGAVLTTVEWGMSLNGIDYDLVEYAHSTLAVREIASGYDVIPSVGVGNWTIRVRWRRPIGTGTATMGTSDRGQLWLREVIE